MSAGTPASRRAAVPSRLPARRHGGFLLRVYLRRAAWRFRQRRRAPAADVLAAPPVAVGVRREPWRSLPDDERAASCETAAGAGRAGAAPPVAVAERNTTGADGSCGSGAFFMPGGGGRRGFRRLAGAAAGFVAGAERLLARRRVGGAAGAGGDDGGATRLACSTSSGGGCCIVCVSITVSSAVAASATGTRSRCHQALAIGGAAKNTSGGGRRRGSRRRARAVRRPPRHDSAPRARDRAADHRLPRRLPVVSSGFIANPPARGAALPMA